jgi:flavin reductase (DIM6/NTAB) family NADH-FMN oxidoreductase RutF
MALRQRALSKVYQLLEPGPVVPLTTSSGGRANVGTMSWHMMVEFEPPLVACVVSEANFSFAALRSTGEAVIAIHARGLADKVLKVGNCSGRNNDKFKRFGIDASPSPTGPCAIDQGMLLQS